MDWSGKSVLVTGGAGFVGSHLTKKLVSLGANVTVVDNLLTGKKEHLTNVLNQIGFIQGDCVAYLRNKPKFDMAFHFAAAYPSRAKMAENPVALCTNFAINDAFFQWAAETRPERILVPSSPAAYSIALQTGNPARKLKEEDLDFNKGMNPDEVYGWSKVIAELEMKQLVKTGVKGAIIRPFSGYGPGQSADFPTTAIGKRALNKEDPITIWGPGTQVRDFIYIGDIVEGALLAIEKIEDGSALNLGCEEADFIKVAKTYAELVGYSPQIKTMPDKPTGVQYRVADISMAKSLGWEPKVKLRDGLGKVLAHLKSHETA